MAKIEKHETRRPVVFAEHALMDTLHQGVRRSKENVALELQNIEFSASIFEGEFVPRATLDIAADFATNERTLDDVDTAVIDGEKNRRNDDSYTNAFKESGERNH